MEYKHIFSPITNLSNRKNSVYIYSEEIILAINIALATQRPLLIRGAPGSGKSSLAEDVALQFGWAFYEEVISSRTQAQDLLWRFDTLRRLNDAQAQQLNNSVLAYINPGVLWWAFDFESATRRGAPPNMLIEEATCPGTITTNSKQSVVLLDEIDKADPDVPNNLLVPIGSLQFRVQESGFLVKAQNPPLIFITTNEERDLPKAFLRRCVILTLDHPKNDKLIEIAKAHFGNNDIELYEAIIEIMSKIVGYDKGNINSLPSTAEYLDTIRTCRELGVEPNSSILNQISKMTLSKPMNPLDSR